MLDVHVKSVFADETTFLIRAWDGVGGCRVRDKGFDPCHADGWASTTPKGDL